MQSLEIMDAIYKLSEACGQLGLDTPKAIVFRSKSDLDTVVHTLKAETHLLGEIHGVSTLFGIELHSIDGTS